MFVILSAVDALTSWVHKAIVWASLASDSVDACAIRYGVSLVIFGPHSSWLGPSV